MEYPNHAMGMDLSPTEQSDEMRFLGCFTRNDMSGSVDNDENDGEGCGCATSPCGHSSWGLVRYPLAMVYSPCQTFGGLYDLNTALTRGTLFAELDLPLEVGYATGCGSAQKFKGRGCSC